MISKKHTTLYKLGVYILVFVLAIIALQESCPESFEICSTWPDFRLVSDDLTRGIQSLLSSTLAAVVSIPSLNSTLIMREMLTIDTAAYCGTFTRDFLHKMGFPGGSTHNNCHELWGLTAEDFAERPSGSLPRHTVLVVLLAIALVDLVERYEHNERAMEENLAAYRLRSSDPPRGRQRSPIRPTNPDQGLNSDVNHTVNQSNGKEESDRK